MIISLDTETTGVDLAHGAMPFLVTISGDDQITRYWEWSVDPMTRLSDIPTEDVDDIAALIDSAELIYTHNGKFDAHALAAVGIELPWSKIRDSFVAAHLLGSNLRHNLTDSCLLYLGVDIEPYEVEVKRVVQECRAIARRAHPEWRLAEEDQEGMPSVKGSSSRDEDKPWKNDMWLPRTMSHDIHRHEETTSEWLTVCARYANTDSEYTLALGVEMERLIRERGLWPQYLHKLQVQRIAYEMECYGVTARGDYTERTIRQYEVFVCEAACALTEIAAEFGHDLELAQGPAVNDNMRDFFYGAIEQSCPRCSYRRRVKHWNGESYQPNGLCPKCLAGTKRRAGVQQTLYTQSRPNLSLPVVISDKTGSSTLDKDAMDNYLRTTKGSTLEFVRLLLTKRRHDTGLSYMEGYRRYWLPVPGAPGFYRIHPSLNPCGTDHLRWSSNSPNLQNVGKKEARCEECDGEGCDGCGGTGIVMASARNCFGPAPGREWWSMDFQSIENRIPAYESGEEVLIELFEKPDEPPLWGSNHNLTCSILWPHLYGPVEHIKDGFKKRYINEYKSGKNTNFAKQYLAGKRKVDATSGVPGAYELLNRATPKLKKLQDHYLHLAERNGYVETLPDRTIDPKRGYPILARQTESGRVLSTTPFNYHVSGTACQCKNTALVRCAAQCARWRAEGFDAYIPLEVHDEILFDFPRGKDMQENLPRAMVLKKLMEESGENLIPRIPLPVSVGYHDRTWAKEVTA